MRKGTYIDGNNRRRVHRWTDRDLNFQADVYKGGVHEWVIIIGSSQWEVREYRTAVDIVMDEYRLLKTGFTSWEELAATMAEVPWEDLSGEEQQDLVNAARLMARIA